MTLKKSGQIYIPKFFRDEINLKIGDNINIFLDGKKLF
ncbi:AbrB/MazE/SpoVT family DNA-binding domain-containing protein [Neobacillus niacini]